MFITILKCIISRTLRNVIVLRSNLISFYLQPAFSAEECISTTWSKTASESDIFELSLIYLT